MSLWSSIFGGRSPTLEQKPFTSEEERDQYMVNEKMRANQQEIYRAYLDENMAKTAESKIKDKVKKALDDLDVYYTMPFTAGYGNSGVPDFLCCIEGRFFGLECKAGKNTTTALQDKHLSDIRAAGGVSLVINEANVDNVKALILANIGATNSEQ